MLTGIWSMGGSGSGSGSAAEITGRVPVYSGIRTTWTVYSSLVVLSSAVHTTEMGLSPSLSSVMSPVPVMPLDLLSLAEALTFTVFVSKGT